MTWSNLLEIIHTNNDFLLSTHINSDGDSICSELALYWYLVSLGKEVVMFNKDPVPDKFTFLTYADAIQNTLPARNFDVFVMLDSSNPSRLGWSDFSAVAPVSINIDHHKDNTREATNNIVDENAAATSQILYSFFKETNTRYPRHIAEILYAGILTDTGGFQFSNTNSQVLSICADLAAQGANCSEIYRKIYTIFSPQALLLRAKVWNSLTFYYNNRICSLEMPAGLIDEIGANYGDVEGMSDQALTAQGVEVGMFIKYGEAFTHFSLRSMGSVDVGKIAQMIPGGGGHTCAAGCTITLPIAQAKEKMLELIKKELK